MEDDAPKLESIETLAREILVADRYSRALGRAGIKNRNYAHIHQHFLYLPVPRAIRSSKMSPRNDVYITPAAPSRKWS